MKKRWFKIENGIVLPNIENPVDEDKKALLLIQKGEEV